MTWGTLGVGGVYEEWVQFSMCESAVFSILFGA